jgi:hypothetical protein
MSIRGFSISLALHLQRADLGFASGHHQIMYSRGLRRKGPIHPGKGSSLIRDTRRPLFSTH